MSWERYERQYQSIKQVLFISVIVDANCLTSFSSFSCSVKAFDNQDTWEDEGKDFLRLKLEQMKGDPCGLDTTARPLLIFYYENNNRIGFQFLI